LLSAASCNARSAAIKRDAETTWTSERIESALFRERINDVADEVARITQMLESPGSLIAPASGYVAPATGTQRQTGRLAIDSASADAYINTGALADRIRALRTELKAISEFAETSCVEAFADIALALEFGPERRQSLT
jgi:hypothetical protein